MLRKPLADADIRQMSLQHSEAILDVTRAFLRARLPSDFAAVTTGPIHKLEALSSAFDSEYDVQKEVEIHSLVLDIEKDRATVDAKATFRYTSPGTGSDWTHQTDGVVHLRQEAAGWRVSDFVDNRRSQLSGIFLEQFVGHEFEGVRIAPLAAELSFMGTLVVFEVVNRTTEPIELVFARLHYKSFRKLSTVPERSHIAPPGTTTRSLAIFPIALPVETPKFRLELGMLGVRSNSGYNIALDMGLNSTEIDAPEAKKRRGRRMNLPFAARLGLGVAALAAFFGGLALLPDAAAPPIVPKAPVPRAAPAEAIAEADAFVEALRNHDNADALELLDSHAPQRRRLVVSLTKSLGEKPNATLGPPRGELHPADPFIRTPQVLLYYPLTGDQCPAGQPKSLGWLDVILHRAKGRWSLDWASYRNDRTPCS